MPEHLELATAEDTDQLGRQLALAVVAVAPESFCIFLRGELGAGKTALARGFLRGCGHAGRVPSPTYTLVEPYTCGNYELFHMDLYRLSDPGELEYLGLEELDTPGKLLLIEWPEHGAEVLLYADLDIELKVNSLGRRCALTAGGPLGEAVLGRVPLLLNS
jgi:tRNA threonylcarbamoyladenosine biosynthesis protein TsaE